ncbi:hypothetical protein [Neobacillus drentensis]|uniref:hypothetical protein n=1 Tax=Neobacillus drentensis TaxID=220684 RepID=UPI002FFE89C0
MARKKEEKIDYVKMFQEQWVNKYDEESLKGKSGEQLSKILEEFEDGLAEARKKQEEYNSIGVSWVKLADNVLIKFEFQDEERIKDAIFKQKRELGFLLDDEEHAMREKMTPFELKTLEETRDKVKKGVEYNCTYRKSGGVISSIGTPNKEALAKFISKLTQERGLSSLRPETQIGLLFNSWKKS